MNCLKMEIDKKIIKKLIDALEDLKKSLNKNGDKLKFLKLNLMTTIQKLKIINR